ncbi:unnamed protein product [Symbiodinium pilosum]|uniref:Sperm microtubule inner protein 1 C-terminal domain-containing protein n=1 Tax=Symbiodinium pilosum TaxID=2952 RepID=A0A812SGX0_SYMPI|nr:unnamed protein product [Symbiodinium pilosum]
MLDKQMEFRRSQGEIRTVKLPRAHTNIGPFPGCKRNAQLSPRKSAAVCFLEQRLLRADSDSKIQTMRDSLYDGVSGTGEGRYKYLKHRAKTSIQSRYGDEPTTTSQEYGWSRPTGEYRASPYCHKPGVVDAFNRPSGVITYKDLPLQSKP